MNDIPDQHRIPAGRYRPVMSTTDTTTTPGTTDTKGSTRMTLDDVKKVLVHAVAAEA